MLRLMAVEFPDRCDGGETIAISYRDGAVSVNAWDAARSRVQLHEATAAEMTDAFVAQAALATLKELIAIGEAANDEKDRRLMADVKPTHISELAQRPSQPFAAPAPDFSGANVDVIRKLFVAQCEADGRAAELQREAMRHGGVPPYMGLTCVLLGVEALLEPEAGSEEGEPDGN